ncbi:NLR family CARD domain-containing protein 3-like [Cheilinus undulatus]|uniref:NLR family CARD domain-containing protein 3-like n=1 Tax=Cheilinus undulatus TaxID=241271 RepID=UPI001BD4B608|nr:NLR family CARD domain-containing protein 3-like [Cheilinus undulatus]
MAERTKKRKRPDSPTSVKPEQPISSSTELQSQQTETSTPPSQVSLKSDASMYEPIWFAHKDKERQLIETSAAPSVLSVKSDASMYEPIWFSHAEKQSCSVCEEALRDPVHFACGHSSCKQCISSDWDQGDSPADYPCKTCGKKPRKETKLPTDIKKNLWGKPFMEATEKFKEAMRNKLTTVSEGNGGPKTSLDNIFTDLLITTQESEGPHEEHVFRSVKQKLEQESTKTKVDLKDIFKSVPRQNRENKTVLTKGVAGIGKSFSVQKFILDWAEGRANQDIDFILFLAFKELNLSKKDKSLHELLKEIHPLLHDLNILGDLMKARVIVILDGLDESRFELNFKKNKPVTSVNEVASVANLITNLIQGNLLPGAKLWITSRPAAADQIPAEFIDMVTEIRGFSNPQKEKYFRKRFSHDLDLADRIISHIRSSHSLDIMCQIPIFCWITAELFQEIFGGDEKAEIPQTLTEMMAHYLFVQIKRRNRKYYEETEENREQLLKKHKDFLLKLGKLAFIQLQRNNLIFYDEDFVDCGIDLKEATIYSGFFNTVLREEQIFSQKRVVFFVHLTIQEFFAALFAYDCLTNQKTEELRDFLNLQDKGLSLVDLLKMTVKKVLEKKNGHLDFFMRFLLGLVVEHNRRILRCLLTSPDPSQAIEKKILSHLKVTKKKHLPPDSSIILFQAMVEMRDHRVKDEIQEFLEQPKRSKTELTPLHCSALAYMLQVSKNDLELLNLKKFNTTDEGRKRLLPAVRISRKAVLAHCNVTEEWVEDLAFGLKFPYLPLRDLDLSTNDLKDPGVELLCAGLSSHCCRLKTLRLSGCMVTEEGCGHLASALKSNPSHLKELDLSYNNLGDSGMKQLTKLKEDSEYRLKTLNVEHGGSHRMKPGLKKYAVELTFDPKTVHKSLALSEGNKKAAWVGEEQRHPHDKETYDHCLVMCEQALDGRCYWEVKVSEPSVIGLTDKPTASDVTDFKLGEESWCLRCFTDGCYVLHGDQRFGVSSLPLRSTRVGVYLDRPAGTLSFYRVSSDSQTHLHTFNTAFSEPLYPAVELHPGSSASLCQLT